MDKIKISETDIQSAIIRYLTVLENQGKLFFNRTNNIPPVNKNSKSEVVGFRRLPAGAKKGIPDIWVILQGKTIGLEVKTAAGRQSKEQKEIEERFKKNGAEYYIVRSLEDVKRILKGDLNVLQM